MIRGIIWDLGGVIVRTVNPQPRLELAAELGLTRRELEQAVFDCEASQLATVGQRSSDYVWENVCAQLKLPPAESTRFQQRFWGGDRVDTELVSFIHSLRPRYRTALLSNAWPDLRRYIEQDWEIAQAFDVIVISAEVGLAKPDGRIYRLALERVGVTAPEAVFIDDIESNVAGARAAGLHAIRFSSPDQARRDLEMLLAKTNSS